MPNSLVNISADSLSLVATLMLEATLAESLAVSLASVLSK